ncbi:MAG: hypothetical protein J5748_03210 [Bacteroidales bacterium]|nr:hypothetical protein [Bacteroidales bacterium]
MKKIIVTVLALVVAVAVAAQSTKEEYLEKYLRLVNRLSYSGVGIETFIDKWEAAFPDDGMMLEARCNYYLDKSMTTQLVAKEGSKYLGNKPALSVPDSTGKVVNFFEEMFFDDELFGKAVSYLYKAIELYPTEMVYRNDLIECLFAYEKESPDMAVKEIEKIVEMEKTTHPEWLVNGVTAKDGDLSEMLSLRCLPLWNIGTPAAYESFYSLSQALAKLFPKDSNYQDNIGSYWLVAKGNDKKAMKFYKKALKLNPDDEVAKTNIKIIERRKAKKK